MIFKKIWRAWRKIGQFIGNTIGYIISTVLYIVFVTPVGIVIRIFTDYFNIKNKSSSNWTVKEQKDLSMDDMRKQY